MFFRWMSFPFRFVFSKVKRAVGKLGLIRLEVFVAFGNDNEVFFKGRLVEAYKQSRPSTAKNAFQNVLATIRRYAGSSVSGAEVKLTFQGVSHLLTTNEEGIFDLHLEALKGNDGGDKAEIQLLEADGLMPEKKITYVTVQRIGQNFPHGIISDIDDTVIVSHATEVGRKLWLSISKNAYTRRPFPGVSEFYRLISSDGLYPLFYVSSSDWNLFDLISDFLKFRSIPHGPLLLKDLHVNLRNIWKSGKGNHDHKLEKIALLMRMFPGLQFVLIGDSGQRDPELYAEVMEAFPGRVKAVYIRVIRGRNDEREHALNKFASEVPVAWVESSDEAIRHARQYGLIVPAS